MTDDVNRVLAELEERHARECQAMAAMPLDEFFSRRDEFLIPIGPQTGAFVNALLKGLNSQLILELGTCYGYSTVWLAEAARETGGRVVTIERLPEKIDYARAVIQRAGLQPYVDFRVGDALSLIPSLGPAVDFVLLDVWKGLYVECFDLVYSKLIPGAVIVADNMTQPERYREEASRYRSHVKSKPYVDSLLLSIGQGLELTLYNGPAQVREPGVGQA